jgi:hypothetical protein
MMNDITTRSGKEKNDPIGQKLSIGTNNMRCWKYDTVGIAVGYHPSTNNCAGISKSSKMYLVPPSSGILICE